MMLSLVAVFAAMLFTWCLSELVEKSLHRSKREFRSPHWYIALLVVSLPSMWLLSEIVDAKNPFIYSAYGLVGGMAALVAQCLFGKKIRQ
jgi:multidrug transporter EmrE-like cation transporter